MLEGFVGPACVVHRLAECEIEVEAILVLQPRRGERLLHRRNVRLIEPDGLEIGQAPPRLTEGRLSTALR
jgi:hypothetical protein